MLVYIWYEYPLLYGNAAWPFMPWSAEMFLLYGQGGLWILSTTVHIMFVPLLLPIANARYALENGLASGCTCDPCELPEDEVQRAQAEAICKAACNVKCPPETAPCPLK